MRTYLRYTCSIIFNHVQLATGNHLTLRLGVDDCRLRPAAAVHGYSMLAKVSSCNPQFLMFSICTCVQGNVSVFSLEVLRWRHLPNGFEQKRSEGHLTLHPSRINPYHIWFFHVHPYRPQNPNRKLQEKNWWKGQVMKSGDLPGFGWMPTIDPSKAWGISPWSRRDPPSHVLVPRSAWLDGRPSRRAAMSLGNKKSASLSLNLCLCQYQSASKQVWM